MKTFLLYPYIAILVEIQYILYLKIQRKILTLIVHHTRQIHSYALLTAIVNIS